MRDITIQRAWASYENNHTQQSITLCKEVLGDDPEDSEVHALLALNLLDQGRIYAAQYEASLALKLEPNSVIPHWVEGQISLLQNQPKRAIACAEECLRLEASHPQALLLKSRAYILLSQFDAAIESLKALRAENPNDPDVMYAIAQAHYAKNDIVITSNLCEAALSINPDHTDTHILLGRIALAKGDAEEAARILDLFDRFDPARNVMIPALHD